MLQLIAIAALAFAPQSSDYEQGVALFQRGEAEAAIPLLERAVAAKPANAQAWKALGVVYASRSQYDAAVPAFARACELAPHLEDACYYEGRALYALNRFEPSLTALAKAGNGWKVDLGIGQALEALGRWTEAEAAFRKALAGSHNSDPAPGIALGLFLVRQGRIEEAAAPLEAVLARFPRSADAHTYLGRALLEKGAVAEATAHLERAVTIAPASAQAHLLLAKSYVRTGRAAEAQPHFEAAARAELPPKDPDEALAALRRSGATGGSGDACQRPGASAPAR